MSFLRHTRPLIFSFLTLYSTLITGCVPVPRQGTEFQAFIPYLDKDLRENSGMIWYRGKVWTLNDSGGEPELYAVETESGKILQTIRLKDTRNRDWEELAQDEHYIYICDIGNNYGNRNKLRIYRIAKASVPETGDVKLEPDEIRYRYADQPEEWPGGLRSSFDCESAFVWQDSLWLLTKDWQQQSSTLYVCPTEPGEYVLRPRMTLPVGGLLTAADVSPGGEFIILLGYRDFVPFLWVWPGTGGPRDFSRAVRVDFPQYHELQAEGIAVLSPDSILISNEQSRGYPASVHRVDLSIFLDAQIIK